MEFKNYSLEEVRIEQGKNKEKVCAFEEQIELFHEKIFLLQDEILKKQAEIQDLNEKIASFQENVSSLKVENLKLRDLEEELQKSSQDSFSVMDVSLMCVALYDERFELQTECHLGFIPYLVNSSQELGDELLSTDASTFSKSVVPNPAGIEYFFESKTVENIDSIRKSVYFPGIPLICLVDLMKEACEVVPQLPNGMVGYQEIFKIAEYAYCHWSELPKELLGKHENFFSQDEKRMVKRP